MKSWQEAQGGVGTCAGISGAQRPEATSQRKLSLLGEALILWEKRSNKHKAKSPCTQKNPKGSQGDHSSHLGGGQGGEGTKTHERVGLGW